MSILNHRKEVIFIIQIFLDGGVKDKYMYISVLSTSTTLPLKFSKKLGQGSSHSAEEQALFHCITILKGLQLNTEDIILHSDQKSLINTLNSDTISDKAAKTFPKAKVIKNFITKSKIKIKWVQGKHNVAHSLINDAYNGVFYNEVPSNYEKTSSQITPSKEVDNTHYIEFLEKELIKKDTLIKDLMKIITKLNNSTAAV